jgi:hypothetical protein
MGGERRRQGSYSAALSGGMLSAVVLLWLVLCLFAPGVGSVVAVFGSPVFAFFVILRLLTLPKPSISRRAGPGRTLSDLVGDPQLLERVVARDGNICACCGCAGPLQLRPVLPIGLNHLDVERRLVAVCRDCCRQRWPARVGPSPGSAWNSAPECGRLAEDARGR